VRFDRNRSRLRPLCDCVHPASLGSSRIVPGVRIEPHSVVCVMTESHTGTGDDRNHGMVKGTRRYKSPLVMSSASLKFTGRVCWTTRVSIDQTRLQSREGPRNDLLRQIDDLGKMSEHETTEPFFAWEAPFHKVCPVSRYLLQFDCCGHA
jgi:hypothetical protein